MRWFFFLPFVRARGPSNLREEAERLGREGERAAEMALVGAGYRILARNVRTPAGEIDLLAVEGDTLALVEVKATRGPGRPSPAGRVDRAKERRLRGALRFLGRGEGVASMPFRFDVVAAVKVEGRWRIEVRRGAFRPRGRCSASARRYTSLN